MSGFRTSISPRSFCGSSEFARSSFRCGFQLVRFLFRGFPNLVGFSARRSFEIVSCSFQMVF
jgi:hypothetical protein